MVGEVSREEEVVWWRRGAEKKGLEGSDTFIQKDKLTDAREPGWHKGAGF